MRAFVALGLLLLHSISVQSLSREDKLRPGRESGSGSGAGMGSGASNKQPQVDSPVVTTTSPETSPTYWVTFASKIRPGMVLPVTVQLVNAGVSRVSVSLRNSTVVFAEVPPQEVFGGAEPSVIELEIPRGLKQPSYRDPYVVRVIATGRVNFNESESVTFNEKSFSIFVQTDKGVYKPGQTVRFRALAMNLDLTVLKEPMDIIIRDPLGNGIKQWKNVQGFGDTGVVERSMPTSSDPPLGDWSIDVTILGQTETKKFSIDKYVLPKFEAKLDIPKIVLTSAPGFAGKAIGKYTFGKPLTDAEVLVTLKYNYYYNRYNKEKPQPTVTKKGKLDKNGEFHFLFNMDELLELTWQNEYNYRSAKRQHLRLDWKTMMVMVNITDVRTGQQMGAVGDVSFRKQKAKMKFLSISPKTYKPGLKYTAHLSVTEQDDTLFENYKDINVTFNVTISVPRPTTTTTSTTTTTTSAPLTSSTDMYNKTYETEEVMPEPEIDYVGKRRYPYWPQEDTIVLITVNKTLTASGFLSIEVDVPSYARSVNIKAATLGVTTQKSAEKAASGNGYYIQIQAGTENPKVGDQVTFNVRTTEPVENIQFQVYAKGMQLNSAQTGPDHGDPQHFLVSFPVTANMAPNCRLLVFFFCTLGEVVADSLSFKVEPSPIGQVNVSYDKQRVKPGEEVHMTVTARPTSTVFLLGIDKSVKLLKSGNDITQEMVDEQLVQYDYGSGFFGFYRMMAICGWPYPSQGVDADGVFRDANVAMLTDGNLYKKPVERHFYHDGPFMMMRASSAGYGGAAGRILDAGFAGGFAPVERVRSFFPETWLWDSVLIGY